MGRRRGGALRRKSDSTHLSCACGESSCARGKPDLSPAFWGICRGPARFRHVRCELTLAATNDSRLTLA